MNGSLTQVSIEPSVLWQFQKGKRGIFVILQVGRQANGEGMQFPPAGYAIVRYCFKNP